MWDLQGTSINLKVLVVGRKKESKKPLNGIRLSCHGLLLVGWTS